MYTYIHRLISIYASKIYICGIVYNKYYISLIPICSIMSRSSNAVKSLSKSRRLNCKAWIAPCKAVKEA